MKKRHSYLLWDKREVGQRLSDRSSPAGLEHKKKDIHRMSLFCIIESTRRRRTSGGRSTATTGAERRHSNRSSPAGLEHRKKSHPSDDSFFYHWEHETGFEPATLALARRYSTTEPLVHTYLQNHILKSIFTVSSTNQTFLDKPSTD